MKKRVSFTTENARSKDIIVRIPVSQKSAAEETDFDKDYYEILGIDKTSFPSGKTRENKIAITRLLEKAFRQRARKCHPDFGGSNEAFLNLVRARRILEDPLLKKIFDQGQFFSFKGGKLRVKLLTINIIK